MSKPWFLEMALKAEPSPLGHTITSILKPGQPDKGPNVKTADANPATISERVQVEHTDGPNAKDDNKL